MFRSIHFLPVLVALAITSASGQSLEERYWLALNEGRDLSEMHSVVEKLAGPGRQLPVKPEIRAEALKLLDEIERTAPLDELAVDSDGVAPFVGADWPSMGVPWRICNVAGAADGQIVLVSVFGNAYELPFDMRLFGLDLKTGRQLWALSGPGGLTAPVFTAQDRFTIGSMGSPFLYGYQLDESFEEPPKLLWRLKTGGVMYESLPAVSGDLGFFLSNDGWMRAVQ